MTESAAVSLNVESDQPTLDPRKFGTFVPSRLTEIYDVGALEDPYVESETIQQAMAWLGVPKAIIGLLLEISSETRQDVIEVARQMGFPAGEQLTKALAIDHGLAYLPRRATESIDSDALQNDVLPVGDGLMPPALPCARSGNRLLLALSRPQDMRIARNGYYGQGLKLDFCLTSSATYEKFYRTRYANTAELFDQSVHDEAGPQSIISALLIHAVSIGASDIHLEPGLHHGTIFLRVDGVREHFRVLSLTRDVDSDTYRGGMKGPFGELINRIQNSSQSDIDMAAEGALEGLVPDALKGRYEFRLELTRTIFGLRAVIRVLDLTGEGADIDDLGIDDKTVRQLLGVTQKDSGLVLFTGPTGSGKTTTQAALLKTINPVERSIQTIENPVEFRTGLWVQHPLTKRNDQGDESTRQATLLRGLLRADPEVAMVGELRDADNTMLAIEAANTGHMVFSTLHANSAVRAIMRLRSMRSRRTDEKIDMVSVMSVLRAIVAQRLARRLCPHCCVPDNTDHTYEELLRLQLEVDDAMMAREGGCSRCRHTGYAGRILIYELLLMTPELRQQIARGVTAQEIEARISPFERMWGRGLTYVAQGLTSFSEVQRVVSDD